MTDTPEENKEENKLPEAEQKPETKAAPKSGSKTGTGKKRGRKPGSKKKSTKKPDTMPKVTSLSDVKKRPFEDDLSKISSNKKIRYDLRSIDPGDTAVYIQNALIALDLPPINPYDANQVEDRIREYFEFCYRANKIPNMVGMANWLGVGKDELDKWKRGITPNKEKFAIVQRMLTVFEELMIDYAQNTKGNPALSIFLMKNWFGYRDMQEVTMAQRNPIGEIAMQEDLANKYLNLDTAESVDDALPVDAQIVSDASELTEQEAEVYSDGEWSKSGYTSIEEDYGPSGT